MKIKIIGLYQLITGVFGALLLILNIFLNTEKVLSNSSLIFLLALGIFLFAGTAYAGYALLNGLRNRFAYSIFSQALQSVSFIAAGFQYKFTASAFLALEFGSGNFFHFQISPIAYNISRMLMTDGASVKIYLIPILLIILLATDKKK